MKVKKVKSIKCNKSKFGLKDLRVNLTRLDKETVKRYLKSVDVNSFNFCIKIKNGKIEFGNEIGAIVPMTITISTSIQRPENKYSLRVRTASQKIETKVPKPKNAVSEISVSVRKQQLWASCKRAVNKSKLIVGSIVFGKQVYEMFFGDLSFCGVNFLRLDLLMFGKFDSF